MARLYTEQAIPPVSIAGATVAPPSADTLQVDRVAVIYEPDAAETRAPYIAGFFRVTASGAGTWSFPSSYGFRLLLTYTDSDTLELIMRPKSLDDNAWSGVTIAAAGSYWMKCILSGTDADFQRQATPPSAATVPLTSSTAVERFTISSSKTPRDVEFFDDIAA